MPKYSFKCPNCNNIFEEVLHMDHRSIITCPECRSPSRRYIGKDVPFLTSAAIPTRSATPKNAGDLETYVS